jgi:hypothetical protein
MCIFCLFFRIPHKYCYGNLRSSHLYEELMSTIIMKEKLKGYFLHVVLLAFTSVFSTIWKKEIENILLRYTKTEKSSNWALLTEHISTVSQLHIYSNVLKCLYWLKMKQFITCPLLCGNSIPSYSKIRQIAWVHYRLWTDSTQTCAGTDLSILST